MKYITIILALISFNICFSQERINNINEKNSTEKIESIRENIDELKQQREKILSGNKILTEEEKNQIKKIDERIHIREEEIRMSIDNKKNK